MYRYKRSLIISITFLAGSSVFIYQILWIRMFALVFGTTTIATAVVISVFMTGMGLGSLIIGHRADQSRYPGRIFALCSFITGVSSFGLFFVIDPSSPLYNVFPRIMSIQGTPISTMVIVSIVLMIVPTFFMGAALPLLSRIYVGHRERIGAQISWLYAIYTIGSAIGALLTGYILIPQYGQTFSFMLAMFTSFVAGALMIVMPGLSPFTTNNVSSPRSMRPVRKRRPSFTLLAIAFLIGFCGLALEVVWTRVLRTYISNSTYSFTNVIIIYMIGILTGSLLYYKRLYRKSETGLLSTSLFAVGGYVLLSLLVIDHLPSTLFLLKGFLSIPVLRMILPGVILSVILIIIPALFMGVMFPHICQLYTKRLAHVGRNVGRVLFLNICGSVTGSLVAGFILIPHIGVIYSIGSIALLLCGGALFTILFMPSRKSTTRTRIIYTGVFACSILVFLIGTQNTMILPPSFSRSALRVEKIVFYRETHDGTVIVTEDLHTGIRACYINNNAVCGTTYDALKVVKMLGHLPYLFNTNAEKVCVIGFGIGITTSALAEHEPIRIDCIEICPGVSDASSFFHAFNHNILANKVVNLIPGDGRAHLRNTSNRYDIISCDPTHPTLGCNNLYTKEYFQLCKTRLTPGGVVCQYLPLHKLTLREFKIAIRTFLSEFPHTTIWLAHAHAIMIGTLDKQVIDFVTIASLLDQINDDILCDPHELTSSLILEGDAARTFVGKGPLNTDNHPYLEFFSPQSTLKDNWDKNLFEIMKYRIPPASIVRNIPEPETMERYLTAQRYFLSALIFKNQGKLDEMIKAMSIAHSINPASDEIRLFLEYERKQLDLNSPQ
jgi:spermidine synthase